MRLVIFRPCISKKTTQKFGENRACIDHTDGSIYGTIRGCLQGDISLYKSMGMSGHNGWDVAGIHGEEIYHSATFEGVMKTERDRSGGLGVDVISLKPLFFPGPIPSYLQATAKPHELEDGTKGFLHYVKMRYWHLSGFVGHDGKRVTCGTVIGLMGNTGMSSGTHLHFAPKWCDKNGRGVGKDNGYYGAFDLASYINFNTTAKEHSRLTTKEALPITEEERKDMLAQLSFAKQLLLALRELIYKL